MGNSLEELFSLASAIVRKSKELTQDSSTISTEELLLGLLAANQIKHHIADEGGIIDNAIELAKENFKSRDKKKYLGRGWDDATEAIITKLEKLR